MSIRVALAEDNLLVREGLSQLLGHDADVEVVSAVGDLASLERAVATERPDVVVTDIRMPPDESDEGIRFATNLRDTHPQIGVVVLSQHADPRYALRLFESGSDRRAYLLKDRIRERDELVRAIGEVATGGSLVD